MKKIFFAVATAAVALFGLTGCGETVTKDITVSAVDYFHYSGSSFDADGSNGVTRQQVQQTFMTELKKIGTPATESAVVLQKQTDAKAVSKAIKEAADNADQIVRTMLGVPDKLDPGYSALSVVVSYTDFEDKKVELTYTYLEEK